MNILKVIFNNLTKKLESFFATWLNTIMVIVLIKIQLQVGSIINTVIENLRKVKLVLICLINSLIISFIFNLNQIRFKVINIIILAKKFLFSYTTPSNLNYFWNTGSLLLLFLVIQIVTGVLLACWYIPHVDYAFDSIENIMREVRYGWLLRYCHANGASFFFGIMFIHILKNIYYGSYLYPRQAVWYTGVIIYILSMGTAFLGYILPWGQMSYWAATVITSLLSAVPVIGDKILLFVWGSLSVSQPTLSRVFALHFILPFVIAALVVIHLTLLHQVGSNNPTGVKSKDLTSFFPNYFSKDLLGIIVVLFIFAYFVFFDPNVLLHPDNYIKANPEVTPAHIVPEWYFLLFYGILRSIPSKVGGIILVILALTSLFIFPIISRPLLRSNRYKPYHARLFWFFVVDCFLLSWTACNEIVTPFYEIGQCCTVFFFLFFFVFNPLCDFYEKLMYKYSKLDALEHKKVLLEEKRLNNIEDLSIKASNLNDKK
jgi:ubiquinol-cytochrome c reductase cytochrome b subunit